MKSKFLQCMRNIKNCKQLPEWIAVVVVLTFSMVTMFYSDFQGTMDYVYQVTRSILMGDFSGVPHIMANSYGMTMFIVLFLWMLPYGIITLVVYGTDFWYFNSISGALWSKLFLTFMTFCLIKGMLKLIKEFEIKGAYEKWMPLFCLTSSFYFVPVVQIGQCDIIALTFMIWGVVYYVRGDLKKFIAFFAVAMPMKYFSLMIFIPLVLLNEKNPLKIIVQGIAGNTILGINLIIRKKVWGTFVGNFAANAISGLSSTPDSGTALKQMQESIIYVESNAIEKFFGDFISNSSLFVMCYIFICILAYVLQYKAQSREYKLWALYLPLLTYSCFILLTSVNSYWLVLIMPFLAILIFVNNNAICMRTSMLLEMIAGWAVTFIFIFKQAWVVGGVDTFEYMFLRGRTIGNNVETFIHSEYDFSGYLSYANSAYVVCLSALLVLNMPYLMQKQKIDESLQKFDRWVIWIRICILYAWVALLIFALLLHGHD